MDLLNALTEKFSLYNGSPKTEVNGESVTEGSSYANGVNHFAMELFKQVSWTKTGFKDNVFIAPVSVHSTLAMLHLGSGGNTKMELENVLHLDAYDTKQVAQFYQEFKNSLLNNDADYTLNIANKLYYDQTVQLCNDVLQYLTTEKINFSSSPNLARENINKWVENQTDNKIMELIPHGVRYIRPETRIVVVSATYFNGKWITQFDKQTTGEQDFFIRPDTKTSIQMMHQTNTFLFTNDPELDCTAIELPYAGSKLSMVILLPNQKTYIEYLIAKLTMKNFKNLYSQFKSTLVSVSVPKFKIGQSMEMIENVKSLGIHDLFDRDTADLSGFTGDKGFYATFVLHKAYIEVSEDGTEELPANKASLGLRRRPSWLNKKQPKEFLVNRPFVFFIYDNQADSILFIGLIRDPSKQN